MERQVAQQRTRLLRAETLDNVLAATGAQAAEQLNSPFRRILHSLFP